MATVLKSWPGSDIVSLIYLNSGTFETEHHLFNCRLIDGCDAGQFRAC